MKKIYLSSIILILCVLIYPNITNAGLSEDCSAFTCPSGQDYYAGDCNIHITTLDDCANVPASGYQKAFNCTAGCTQSFIALANWKPESGKVWYSAGNVGIGTSSPSAEFEVNGSMKAINMILSGGLAVTGIGVDVDGDMNVDGMLKVGENVGIGTDSPGDYRLNIKQKGESTGTGIRLQNNDNSKSMQMWIGSGGAVVDAEDSTNLHLRTGGIDRLFIDNDTGNVGIGTTSPSAKLEVNGNIITTPGRSGPHLTLDSTSDGGSGVKWSSQGAYIAIGESANSLGGAAMYMTYRGDGYGFIGSGALSTGASDGGVPGYSYLRFDYNSNDIYTPDTITAGNLECSGCIDVGDIGTDAVGSSEVINQSLRSWDLAPDSVGSSELSESAISVSSNDQCLVTTSSGSWVSNDCSGTWDYCGLMRTQGQGGCRILYDGGRDKFVIAGYSRNSVEQKCGARCLNW